MDKVLFIIGMPGVGKTKWGREVASAFGLPFFDLDLCIEARQNKTITRIFAEQGEMAFRRLEDETLRDIVKNNDAPFILSCGGGTPVNPANLSFMKQNGTLVYLKASIPVILANLKDGLTQRPLLATGDISPVSRLEQLYKERSSIYEQADHTLGVEHLSIQDFAPILQACIKQH